MGVGYPFEATGNQTSFVSYDGHDSNNTALFTNSSFIREDVDHKKMYQLARLLRNIFVPVIILIGIGGNSVAVGVFSISHLKHTSSSKFLAALSCADNVFLIVLFVTWLDGHLDNTISTDVTCQITVYLTYVSSFLSVWYIVAFTTERYIAICHPFKAKICSTVKQKCFALMLLCVALLFYSFAFWSTKITSFQGKSQCVVVNEHMYLLKVVTWIDTTITMIIPSLLIISMNAMVGCRARSFYKKRRYCFKPQESKRIRYAHHLRNRPQMRLTRTLVLISSTFVLMNLPSHVLRLYYLILSTLHGQVEVSVKQYFVQEMVQILYYAAFSVNMFLYTLFTKHFQRSLILLWRSWVNKWF